MKKRDPKTRPVTCLKRRAVIGLNDKRRRGQGGGVGSLEWHNYNKLELAAEGEVCDIVTLTLSGKSKNQHCSLTCLVWFREKREGFVWKTMWKEGCLEESVFLDGFWHLFILRLGSAQRCWGTASWFINPVAWLCCFFSTLPWNRGECQWPLQPAPPLLLLPLLGVSAMMMRKRKWRRGKRVKAKRTFQSSQLKKENAWPALTGSINLLFEVVLIGVFKKWPVPVHES